MQLRAATPNDAVDVQRLLVAGLVAAPADLADRLGESLAETGSETQVTTPDGVPVGTLGATRTDQVGGVHGFVVDPARQRRGIGR